MVACLIALAGLGAECSQAPTCADCVPPELSITLNGIPDDEKGLLVVPPSGFVVNVEVMLAGAGFDAGNLGLAVQKWGSEDLIDVSSLLQLDPSGLRATAIVPAAMGLDPGTWTVTTGVLDDAGAAAIVELDFAVRDFANGPPIGGGQQKVWLDFTADRDAVPGADFTVDLELFGLASPSAPELSAVVEQRVIAKAFGRVAEAYWLSPGNGLTGFDPVTIDIALQDPGGPNVTRLCIGGEDPLGGSVAGHVQMDPNNANKATDECSNGLGTGIFPAELLFFDFDPLFKQAFDPLRVGAVGTPVGEHPLDPIVLDAGFQPSLGSPEEQARYDEIQLAIDLLGNVVGSITAHELGHALGAVPQGSPGGGLFGDATHHRMSADGSVPVENYLMSPGTGFTLANLGGFDGEVRPFFSPLVYAYLRDRVVVNGKVDQLLGPPSVLFAWPGMIQGAPTVLSIYGENFAATPTVRLRNELHVYTSIGTEVVSSEELTTVILPFQANPGVYDIELENADGQIATMPGAVTVF